MRVLVAVASKHGSTREIAEAITEALRTHDLTVDLKDVGDVGEISRYDAVVLGSAIYEGRWLPEARSFAEHHRAELSKVTLWLFSSGPLGSENPQPLDDPHKLAAPLGDVPSFDHHIFVGKLDTGKLSFAERLIARAVRAPFGDFRNWDEIRDWTQEIAAELEAERSPFIQ